jgi:hypothetical protein
MGAYAFYDPVRDRMLLFGGRRFSSDPTPMLDVWTLTLSKTPAWSRIEATGEAPVLPGGFAWAVHDARRHRLLVGTFAGTWLYALDLATSLWTRQATASPVHPQHPILRGGSVVLDAVGDRLLCFGGLWEGGPTRACRNTVSELRLRAAVPDWVELHPAGAPPDPRAHQAAVYDAAGQRLLVFGGWWGETYGDALQGDDAWALSLPAAGVPAWSRLPSAGPEGARMGHVVVAVPGAILFFGGAGPPGAPSRAAGLALTYGVGKGTWRPCPAGNARTARAGRVQRGD